jgi:ABC-2 type transport system ATP-binding protein
MWEFMNQINQQGTTIILTTHYLEEAERMCHNVAIIDEGEIIKNTSMKSLLRSLKSETFILYLRDDISQPPALEGFAVPVVIDSHTLEVEVPQTRSLNDLIQQLDSQQIVVSRMRNKVNRLEELFITITSKLEIMHDTVG